MVSGRVVCAFAAAGYNTAMFSRRALSLLLTFIFIAVILAVFIALVDVRQVWASLRAANWLLVLGAALALLVGQAAYATRWRLLLADKPRWLATFHAANVGQAVNILTRLGEPARIVVLGRARSAHIPLAEITSSVIVERLFEQVMRLLALGGAVVFGAGLQPSPGTVGGAVAFVALAFGLMLWLIRHQTAVLEHGPRWLARLPRVQEENARRTLANLLNGLSAVASPRRLALALWWSLISWSAFWAFHVLALMALPTAPREQWLSISLGALALAPPSAPTLPGLYHGSIVAPLSVVGFDGALLTSYAVILHALQMVLLIGLGVWGVNQSGASLGELMPRSEKQGA